MIVLIGPSASGKSTIEKELVQWGYDKITSYTSRPIRKNEEQDVDYHFISPQEFEQNIKAGFFVENTTYRGWYYGIAKQDCKDGKIAVVEPFGYRQIKAIYPDSTISFFIDVPIVECLHRMIHRGDTDYMEMFRRIISDQGTFANVEKECDYIINNNRSLQETAKEIHYIIQNRITRR
jgi:guanylate kinase